MEEIKIIEIEDFTYFFDYNSYKNKIYPCIEIYKDTMFVGELGSYNDLLFFFKINIGTPIFFRGYAKNISRLFEKVQEKIYIPKEIERKFEDIFLVYKLNDFKKL